MRVMQEKRRFSDMDQPGSRLYTYRMMSSDSSHSERERDSVRSVIVLSVTFPFKIIFLIFIVKKRGN